MELELNLEEYRRKSEPIQMFLHRSANEAEQRKFGTPHISRASGTIRMQFVYILVLYAFGDWAETE